MTLREEIKQTIKESLNKQFAKGATEAGTNIYYSKPIVDQILSLIIKRVKGVENPLRWHDKPKCESFASCEQCTWNEAIQAVIKEVSNG